MHYMIKRYVDGSPTDKKPNHLPPINNPSVLNIIDHAIERTNRFQEQRPSSTSQDLFFQNKV